MSSSPSTMGVVCGTDNPTAEQQLSTISSPEHSLAPGLSGTSGSSLVSKSHSIEEMSKSDHEQQDKWPSTAHSSTSNGWNSLWRPEELYRYPYAPNESFTESWNNYNTTHGSHSVHHSNPSNASTQSALYQSAQALYGPHVPLTQTNEQNVYNSSHMLSNSYAEALRKSTHPFGHTAQTGSTLTAGSGNSSLLHPLTIDSTISSHNFPFYPPGNYSSTPFTASFINSSPDSGLTSSSEGAASPHSLAPSYQPLSRTTVESANQALLHQTPHPYSYETQAYHSGSDFMNQHPFNRPRLYPAHQHSLTTSQATTLTTGSENRTHTINTIPSSLSVSAALPVPSLPPTTATSTTPATPTLNAMLKDDNSEISLQQQKNVHNAINGLDATKRTFQAALQNQTNLGTNNTSNNSPMLYNWMKKSGSSSSGTSNTGKTRTKDKYRVVYTEIQRLELEKEFICNQYITIKRKSELASQLELSERQVKIWFQNRRAKKRKQERKSDDTSNISGGSAKKSIGLKKTTSLTMQGSYVPHAGLEHHSCLINSQHSVPARSASLCSGSDSNSSDEGVPSTPHHNNNNTTNNNNNNNNNILTNQLSSYIGCKEERLYDNEINSMNRDDDSEQHRSRPEAQALMGHNRSVYQFPEVSTPIVLSQAHLSTSGAASEIRSPPTGSIHPHTYTHNTPITNEQQTSKSIPNFLSLHDQVNIEATQELTSH